MNRTDAQPSGPIGYLTAGSALALQDCNGEEYAGSLDIWRNSNEIATVPVYLDPIAAQPTTVTDGWKARAAAWLREKAQEQRAINTKYPDHVKAYPSWEAAVTRFEMLARELENAALVESIPACKAFHVGAGDQLEQVAASLETRAVGNDWRTARVLSRIKSALVNFDARRGRWK